MFRFKPPVAESKARKQRPLTMYAAVLVLVLAVGGLLAAWRIHHFQLERGMMAPDPRDVVSKPELVKFATAIAKPLVAKECAACHGASLQGGNGAANLTDGIWLYGSGQPSEIERTIMYGIRAGVAKGHDITEMPAYGQRGLLSEVEIENLTQYLLALNHRPHDDQAAGLGLQVFANPQVNCGDCHGPDATGNPDYGAPDLTADAGWIYGNDIQSIHDSLYYGRHGVMPANIGKLTLEQIRALAVYVYASSHR